MKRLIAGLLLIFILSGFAVIYSKYQARVSFLALQNATYTLDQLEVEWERLTLEEKMLSEHNRVEKIARKRMELIFLERKDIVYIKL